MSGGNETYQNPGDPPDYATQMELYDPNAPLSDPVLLKPVRDQLPYPFMFLLPNGNLYEAGPEPNEQRTLIAPPNETEWRWVYSECTERQYDPGGAEHGAAVMFRLWKMVKAGGSVSEGDPGVALGAWIDRTFPYPPPLAPCAPYWIPFQLVNPRRNHNMVLLPDGRVLCVGGNLNGGAYQYPLGNTNPLPAMKPEIWDPEAPGPPTWVELNAEMANPRYYHSTAMLLRDGSVITAGGEKDPPNDPYPPHPYPKYSSQRYKPSYFDLESQRPVVTGGPTTIQYGSTVITVTYNSMGVDYEIERACLIRLGSTTHGFDQDQRYIALPPIGPTQIPGSVQFNPNLTPNVAPPGYYHLFILHRHESGALLPSTESRIVRVG